MKDFESEINDRYAKIATAENYLNDTDYMMLRESEGGEKMPEEVKAKRAEARREVNQCEEEIKNLEKEREETCSEILYFS